MGDDGIDASTYGNCTTFPTYKDESLNMDSVDDIAKYFLDDDESLSPNKVVNNCLSYISGYVVKQVTPQLTCHHCIEALRTSPHDCIPPEEFDLIIRKDRGNLIKPSRSVVNILKISEKVFEEQVLSRVMLPTKPNLIKTLTSFVDLVIDIDDLFPKLKCKYESDDHLRKLISCVTERYFSVRCKSYVKVFNEDSLTTTSKRNQLLKLVHNLHL